MIDLHCHSIFSDGTDTPVALADMADAMGLCALALTDHDNVEGLISFLAHQPHVTTRLIAGIELSCRFLKMEIHIIGLAFDPTDATFQARIQMIRQRRRDRNDALVERLQAIGIGISLEDVQRLAPTELVSRTHFAKALAQMNVVTAPEEAYLRLIGEGCPAYVPFQDLSPQEAAQWIHEAGGVAIVAHPGRVRKGAFVWDSAMPALRDMGLDGFEAYYGEYSERQEAYFLDLAQQLGMVPSGGSDYHGQMKPHIQLGKGKGRLCVPDSVLSAILARRRAGHGEGGPQKG